MGNKLRSLPVSAIVGVLAFDLVGGAAPTSVIYLDPTLATDMRQEDADPHNHDEPFSGTVELQSASFLIAGGSGESTVTMLSFVGTPLITT